MRVLRLCMGQKCRFWLPHEPASKVSLCDVQAEPQFSQLGISDSQGAYEDEIE